jgi:hypothetical protein
MLFLHDLRGLMLFFIPFVVQSSSCASWSSRDPDIVNAHAEAAAIGATVVGPQRRPAGEHDRQVEGPPLQS